MVKKSAIHGEYLISQDKSGTIKVLKKYDNVIASLHTIVDEVGFDCSPDWNTRQFGSKLIDALS